jgi:hypothetical protein
LIYPAPNLLSRICYFPRYVCVSFSQNGQWLRAEDSAHLSGVIDTLSTAFHRLYAVLAHWESGGNVSGTDH